MFAEQQIQKSAQRHERLAQSVTQSESSLTVTPITELLPPVAQAPDNPFVRNIPFEEWQEMDSTRRH